MAGKLLSFLEADTQTQLFHCTASSGMFSHGMWDGVGQFLGPLKQMSGTGCRPYVPRPASAASSGLTSDQVSEDGEAVLPNRQFPRHLKTFHECAVVPRALRTPEPYH